MTTQNYGNGLALLANKVAARVFDISSGMIHASMRDQIVRAQLLIRDLAALEPQCKKILIVGAGVGGITAATTASYLGIEALVVDTKSRPLDLQANVNTRFVGPFMYEWPDVVCESQSYPLKMLLPRPLNGTPEWDSKRPLSAASFAREFTKWLEGSPFGKTTPRFFYDIDREIVKNFVTSHKEWAEESHRLILNGNSPKAKLEMEFASKTGKVPVKEPGPDYVVLAAGMGDENISLSDSVSGLPFWHDDDLKSSVVDDMTVGVFGGGDGALQDVLRLCTRFDHPIDLIAHINKDPMAKKALSDVLPLLHSLEQQSRVFCSWSNGDTSALIDDKCRDIATKLANNTGVIKQLSGGLRNGKGKVLHIVREGFFGKAYLLNRFCVHLLDQSMRKKFNSPNDRRYELHFDAKDFEVKRNLIGGQDTYNLKLKKQDRQINTTLSRIVVRYGIQKNSLPGQQMIKLDNKTNKDRISMAGVPLPFGLCVDRI